MSNLFNSDTRLSKWLKLLLAAAVFSLGLIHIRYSLETLKEPLVYHKDFMQEYLLARSVLDGVDPYLPLPTLSQMYMGDLPRIEMLHPTPHPPPVALLSLPFGLFPYLEAARIWFIFESLFLILSILFILKAIGVNAKFYHVIILSVFAMAWRPFMANLAYGQLMTLLLFLLAAALYYLKVGKDVRGGVLLGLALAVKFMAWPVFLYLLLRKKWNVLTSGVAVFLALNFASAVLMGYESFSFYYISVSRTVMAYYQAHEGNFSLWTVGWRIFAGTGAVSSGTQAPPLVYYPQAAGLFSVLLVIAVLAVCLYLAWKSGSFEASYGILVCLSLLVSPVYWIYYLILMAFPVAVIWKRVQVSGFPTVESHIALFVTLFLMFPREITVYLLGFFVTGPKINDVSQVSFLGSILTLLPTLVVLVAIWLLVRSDRTRIARRRELPVRSVVKVS